MRINKTTVVGLITMAGLLVGCQSDQGRSASNSNESSTRVRAESESDREWRERQDREASTAARSDRAQADVRYDAQGNRVYDNRAATGHAATESPMYNGGARLSDEERVAVQTNRADGRGDTPDATGNSEDLWVKPKSEASRPRVTYNSEGNVTPDTRADDSRRTQERGEVMAQSGTTYDHRDASTHNNPDGTKIHDNHSATGNSSSAGTRTYADHNATARYDRDANFVDDGRYARSTGAEGTFSATDSPMYNGGRRLTDEARVATDDRGYAITTDSTHHTQTTSPSLATTNTTHSDYASEHHREGSSDGWGTVNDETREGRRIAGGQDGIANEAQYRSTDSPMYNGGRNTATDNQAVTFYGERRISDGEMRTRNFAVDRNGVPLDPQYRAEYERRAIATRGGERNAVASADASFASADARILSILNAKNQEEIELGRLAQEKGTSEEVREYGEELVRDHSENDAEVRKTARDAGIALMQPAQVKHAMLREKGHVEKAPKDCVAELRALKGAEFDKEFARKMQEGHQEMIRLIESARNEVSNPKVVALLDKTLPALREHQQHAMMLDDDWQ